MNTDTLVEKFNQDVEHILLHSSPAESEDWTTEYSREMEIVHALAVTDFSPESRVQHTLKRQLLNTYTGNKENKMNTMLPRKSTIQLSIVGILALLLILFVSPLRTTIAQNLIEILENRQLGQHTSVVSVEGDFEAVQDENGETIISPAPESINDAQGVIPDMALEADQQRRITLDPTTPFEEAQAQLSFTLRRPAYIPEGYEFQGVVVIDSGQAALDYLNSSETRLMGLLQTAVSGPNGKQVQVTMSADILVENVAVNGTEALWTQAGDEGMLIWEADGVNYQLVGLSDLAVARQVAESLE